MLGAKRRKAVLQVSYQNEEKLCKYVCSWKQSKTLPFCRIWSYTKM